MVQCGDHVLLPNSFFYELFSQDPEKLRLRLKICDFGFGLYYGESSSTDSDYGGDKHSGVSERVVRTEDLSLSELQHLWYGIQAPALRPEHEARVEELSQMAAFARCMMHDDYDFYRRILKGEVLLGEKKFNYDCGPRYDVATDYGENDERLAQNVAPYGPFASSGVHPAVGEIIPPEVWHARIHTQLGNRPDDLWPVRGLDVYAAAVRVCRVNSMANSMCGCALYLIKSIKHTYPSL